MKVVLLCGGAGQRMFPITEDKFLLKFLGKTLLEHQIDRAKEAGLTDFVIVTNPHNISRIGEVVKRIPGIKVELALQGRSLGIADALMSAERFLDSDIIVVNPNDIIESSAYRQLLRPGNNGFVTSRLLGYEVSDYFPGGYLVVNGENELKLIVEKPGKGREPSNLVNILVHLHTDPARLLKYCETVESARDDVYERALDCMANNSCKIKVVPYAGFWTPIKYPWHIFNVVKHFLDESEGHISPSADISSRATIEGKVIIEDRVRVLENAVIRGPVYIGPGSVIGNGSLVRAYSHIGEGCVVGFSTEIKGSYVGDGCWFHMNYIGDSIVGERCSFGAGTVLANFRFDEGPVSVRVRDESLDTGRDKLGAIIGNYSKTGVNVSVMPGVKIGPNSIVGSHVCLAEDLAPDKMALSDRMYRVIENRAKPDEANKVKSGRRLERLLCAE